MNSRLGESPLEMEARADEILHSPAITMETIDPMEPAVTAESPQQGTPEDFAAADVEFAQLLVLELYGDQQRTPAPVAAIKSGEPATAAEPSTAAEPAARPAPPVAPAPAESAAPVAPVALDDEPFFQESALEFTLPPGELDRIFVESRPREPRAAAAAAGAGAVALEAIDEPSTRAVKPEVSGGAKRDMPEGLEELALSEIAVRSRRNLLSAVWLCAAILWRCAWRRK